MKKKAYLGIDIGSILTKGVIIAENDQFLTECFFRIEGNLDSWCNRYANGAVS